MNNGIVIRDRVPTGAKMFVWVEPDAGSEGKYQAFLSMHDENNNLIAAGDLAAADSEGSALELDLVAHKVFLLGIEVIFGSDDAKATIQHKILKADGSEFGARFPHPVPDKSIDGVGLQSIVVKMIKA